MFKLREYQKQHRVEILDALNGGSNVLYQSPTGAGKSTVVTSVIAEMAHGDWNGAIVTVPMVHIRDSFLGSPAAPEGLFDSELYDGRPLTRTLSGWLKQHWEDRTFATVVCRQTFTRVSLPKDLTGWALFIDEAHGSTIETGEKLPDLSKYRKQWVDRGGQIVVISATPYRSKGGERVYDETYVQVRRSIAEHSLPDSDGQRYAPSHFELRAAALNGYRVRTKQELYGDAAPSSVDAAAIRKLIKQWNEDGRPKSIVIVPTGDSESWSARVVQVFRKKGARVHNAVGTGKQFQTDLMEALASERGVSRIEHSQIDVIVACARFNEGTDWPLCSHVYHVGFPRSTRLTVQRWGRSFRSKQGIAGHPHPDTANITFFVPEFSDDEVFKAAEFQRSHLRMALLMAGHLEDHRAGQVLLGVMRDVVKRNVPAPGVTVETMESRLKPTDEEMQTVSLVLKHAQPHMENGALDLATIDRIADSLTRDGDNVDRIKMLARLRIAATTDDPDVKAEMLEVLDRAYKKATKGKGGGEPRKANLEATDLIPEFFCAMFDKYVADVHGGKVQFAPPMTSADWQMLLRLTGRDAQDIEASIRKAASERFTSVKQIEEMALAYFKEHGERPTISRSTLWDAANAFLGRRGTSLSLVCDSLGMPPLVHRHTLESIKQDVLAWVKKHGRSPRQRDMHGQHQHIRRNYNMSWAEFMVSMGLGVSDGSNQFRTQASCEKEVRDFVKSRGRAPTYKELGKHGVASWVRKNLGFTWNQYIRSLGYETPNVFGRSKSDVDDAIRSFVARHGSAPGCRDMSAEAQWVKTHLGKKWTEYLAELGYPTRVTRWTIELARSEVARFVEEHGRAPTCSEIPRAYEFVTKRQGLTWQEFMESTGHNSYKNYTRNEESTMSEVCNFVQTHGRIPAMDEMHGASSWVRNNLNMCWSEYLVSIGLQPTRERRTKEQVDRAVIAVCKKLGRAPRKGDCIREKQWVRHNLGMSWPEYIRSLGVQPARITRTTTQAAYRKRRKK